MALKFGLLDDTQIGAKSGWMTGLLIAGGIFDFLIK